MQEIWKFFWNLYLHLVFIWFLSLFIDLRRLLTIKAIFMWSYFHSHVWHELVLRRKKASLAIVYCKALFKLVSKRLSRREFEYPQRPLHYPVNESKMPRRPLLSLKRIYNNQVFLGLLQWRFQIQVMAW